MKKVILIILGLAVLGGLFFFLKNQPGGDISNNTKPEQIVLKTAWVEVERGTLFLKLPGQSKELKSGDEVESGASLETGKNSSATIHLPDGSILNMDKETAVVLSDINFSTDDKTLVVKIGLTVGRVWSKVISLSTPESEWEVKTSNTVATVRGTAFGMGFKSGTSWVNTSENKVAVAPLDPETKEKIKEAEVIIEEKKFIELAEININEALKIKQATSSESVASAKQDFFDKQVKDVPKTIAEDSWVKEVKTKHQKLDKELNDLREKAKNLPENADYRDKYFELNEEVRQSILKGNKIDIEKLMEKILDPKYKKIIEQAIEMQNPNLTDKEREDMAKDMQKQATEMMRDAGIKEVQTITRTAAK